MHIFTVAIVVGKELFENSPTQMADCLVLIKKESRHEDSCMVACWLILHAWLFSFAFCCFGEITMVACIVQATEYITITLSNEH